MKVKILDIHPDDGYFSYAKNIIGVIGNFNLSPALTRRDGYVSGWFYTDTYYKYQVAYFFLAVKIEMIPEEQMFY